MASSSSKKELRQKLESMKQAYAKTLRKVERSEKAKRTRSHVQRRITEQRLQGTSDASPECTHSLRRPVRAIPSPQTTGEQGETESPPATDGKVLITRAEEVSKSSNDTKPSDRKRRSVSFVIPKESATVPHDLIDLVRGMTSDSNSATLGHRGPTSQQATPTKSSSLDTSHDSPSELKESADVRDLPVRSSTTERDGSVTASTPRKSGGRRAATEKPSTTSPTSCLPHTDEVGVKPVSPPAQSGGRIGIDADANQQSINETISADHSGSSGSQPSQLGVVHPRFVHGVSAGDPAASFQPGVSSPAGHATPRLSPTGGENSPRSNSEALPRQPPDVSTVPPRRWKERKRSGRRSRIPRELTLSDISLKEVAAAAASSQSAEDGSHTWIEGLMFPVEYYVRRTRSMTSSQSSQGRSDGSPSQRDSTRDRRAEQKQSLATGCGTNTPEGKATAEGSHTEVSAAAEMPESSADSQSSDLSESLLRTTKALPLPAEGPSDEDFEDAASYTYRASRLGTVRKVKTRRGRHGMRTDPLLSRSRSVLNGCSDSALCLKDGDNRNPECSVTGFSASAPSLDHTLSEDCSHRSATCHSDHVPSEVGSQLSLCRSVRDVSLSQAEFSLPDEDFGPLKRQKLRGNLLPAGDASELKIEQPDGSGAEGGPSDPRITEDPGEDPDTRSSTVIGSVSRPRRSCPAEESRPAGTRETAASVSALSPPSGHIPDSLSADAGSQTIPGAGNSQGIGPGGRALARAQENLPRSPSYDDCDGALQEEAGTVGKRVGDRSQGCNILHSQLSPTQPCQSLVAVAGAGGDKSRVDTARPNCTPGWSPSSTPTGRDAPRRGGEGEPARAAVLEESADKLGAASEAKQSTHKSGTASPCRLDEPSAPPPPRRGASRSSSQQGGCGRPAGAASPTLEGQHLQKNGGTIGDHHLPSRSSSAAAAAAAEGSVTPPAGSGAGPAKTSNGNVQQASPFAGVATGTPPQQAKEPERMSQCGRRATSRPEDDDSSLLSSDDEAPLSSQDLCLVGCLQHEVPWEKAAGALEVTGGRATVNGVDVDVLTILYPCTLVIWWRGEQDDEGFRLLKSWRLPEGEEFTGALVLPCRENNTVVLAVTGFFSSCTIRVLTYDTATSCPRQTDISLSGSWAMAIPYRLCEVNEHCFAVAVRDKRTTTAVFLVNNCIESRDVQTVRLPTDAEADLTSLLPVEGTDGLLLALTSANSLLMWNCKTGDLVKDVKIEFDFDSRSLSCLSAVAELGILYLVMVCPNDSVEDRPVATMMVLNPLTDRMDTLVEYRTPAKHAQSSLLDAVLHNQSLLARLSNGSLHQWDLLSGDLMNYSSLPPTNHSLRSAKLHTSQVVLLGNGSCQLLYNAC